MNIDKKAPDSEEHKPTDQGNDIQVTDEYLEIIRLIEDRSPVVFVSGKAGTGKTTFIDYLRKNDDNTIAVVAPTGVAALQVKGSTIHSLFQFEFGIAPEIKRLSSQKRAVLENLSLLVIDEVSMVRADIMDAIDQSLQTNRNVFYPFGGVSVLLVGDLFQLPPVVKSSDIELLERMGYETPYFFSAKVFQQSGIRLKELTRIFRQSDKAFIDVLNKVRLAECVDDVLPIINKCHKPVSASQKMITLTSINATADEINNTHLRALPGKPAVFTGIISGKFPEDRLPSPLRLHLKVGAQVMFTKNDVNKRWVNGTLGHVTEVGSEVIKVAVGHPQRVFNVVRDGWETIAYVFDEEKNRIDRKVVGSFVQYPLMLAWAITIHKSQGKTLQKVRIDLGRGAFACGQVYVALSRCRAMEDIYLSRPIRASEIKTDIVVKEFYERMVRDSG